VAANKRRKTDNIPVSFRTHVERGEIEGFSSDEDNNGFESNLEDAPRIMRSKSLGEAKEQTDKRTPSSVDVVGKRAKGFLKEKNEVNATWDFPNDACRLLEYYDVPKKEDEEIDCYASEEEKEEEGESGSPQVFSDWSESNSSGIHFLSKHKDQKTALGTATAEASVDDTNASEEVINDFQSDQECSQESLSPDISTPTATPNPTPTPGIPVVDGTPRTASQWLKKVQPKSPNQNEDDKCPEANIVMMSPCHSTAKKRKFVRSGLAERLQLIVSRESSAKTFWNHKVVDKTKECSGSTSVQSDGSVTIHILFDQVQSSHHLTHCSVVCEDSDFIRDPQQIFVFVLFTCETWKQLGLHIGATVKIYLPWQKLHILGVQHPVLLCTYFCEKQATQTSTTVDLQPLTGYCWFVQPGVAAASSSASLVQSPKKGFQPSKLLFGSSHGGSSFQNDISPSSFTAVVPMAPHNPVSKPKKSILAAIDSCGGCSGALVTLQGLIQRVYRKRISLATDGIVNRRCQQVLYQDLKSAAKGGDESRKEQLRWILLIQDICGVCAEIQLPPRCDHLPEWRHCIDEGEGKVFTFSNVRVLQRISSVRSPSLFCLIQSLRPLSDPSEGSTIGSTQTLVQESEGQVINSSFPPNFCYLLTVQESSHAALCQDSDVNNRGWSHKPCVVKTLSDVLSIKKDVPERFSTLCKLIYCRASGSDSVENSLNTFELFVTDSSLVNELRKIGKDDGNLGYVRIIGKKCHVLLEEMKRTSSKFGTILHAKHLLLKEENQELVADTYSVVREALPESTNVWADAMEDLSNLRPAGFPRLSHNSCSNGYIYQVEGEVTGVDEESACCWLVCDTCGTADITCQQGASPLFFCLLCNVSVKSPQTKTHLEVFVEVKSLPRASVKVALLQSTIDRILPVSYQDSHQGYDIEAVLGKQLDAMTCYIIERSQQHGVISFSLEEIKIC